MAGTEDDDSPFVDDPAPAAPEGAIAPPGVWTILIVDDEQEVHDVTALALHRVSFRDRGLRFVSARSAAQARALLRDHPDAAVVLLDVVMETDDAGLELVRYIRQSLRNDQVRVILRTGQPGQAPETTVISEYDISDYRTKTELTATRLFTTIVAALRTYQQLRASEQQRRELERLYEAQKAAFREIEELKCSLERERDYLREEVQEVAGTGHVVGTSPAFRQTLAQLDAVAGTDATVLLLGESGVGKEVLARHIHARSARAAGPLVKVNCASIPRELFESEFFGHVRGAFTGAHRDRVGRFQLADRGTLFLDEVGEIPIELQSKLLRALQERELERVGDTRTHRVDVRVVAATNRDLKAEVAAGRFRADLYYRLVVFPLHVPPLRRRRADIVPLFEHFLARACRELRRPQLTLTACDVAALEAYDWPGNVRELQNVVERAVILATDGVLRLDAALDGGDLTSEREPAFDPPPEPSMPREAVHSTLPPGDHPLADERVLTAAELRELERRNLVAALERTNWKVAGDGGAAALLGVKPSTLTYQMRSFGIERAR